MSHKPRIVVPFRKPPKSSDKNLRMGLKVLPGLWKHGIHPDDLLRHWFLAWFVRNNGNMIRMAYGLKLHRNTFRIMAMRLFGTTRLIPFRFAWQKTSGRRFPHRFAVFYQKKVRTPSFSLQEHEGLLTLWEIGFPLAAARAHYVIWFMRKGIPRKVIERRLKASYRTIDRIRAYGSGEGAGWLAPLKIGRKEWYPSGRLKGSRAT